MSMILSGKFKYMYNFSMLLDIVIVADDLDFNR
jgi:hypothetical protein